MPTNVHKIKRNRNGSAKKGVPHASGYPEAKSISFRQDKGIPPAKGDFKPGYLVVLFPNCLYICAVLSND